eukprot:Phypoly_transcript_13808.p1 GENE.Phypoly_transcript_13808~~Phypoly_transcript_13808.p1  ORF type:complete len:218 (+),score=62.67 Phypoly_transcript_13808:103-756(+)
MHPLPLFPSPSSNTSPPLNKQSSLSSNTPNNSSRQCIGMACKPCRKCRTHMFPPSTQSPNRTNSSNKPNKPTYAAVLPSGPLTPFIFSLPFSFLHPTLNPPHPPHSSLSNPIFCTAPSHSTCTSPPTCTSTKHTPLPTHSSHKPILPTNIPPTNSTTHTPSQQQQPQPTQTTPPNSPSIHYNKEEATSLPDSDSTEHLPPRVVQELAWPESKNSLDE